MKKSARLTALLLAAMIGLASVAEPVMATENDVTPETPSSTAAEEIVANDDETTKAADETVAAEESTEGKESEEESTTAAKKKKVGNLDQYFGLDSKYWVLATAKKKVYVYKQAKKAGKTIGKFTKNNCMVCNFQYAKAGKNYKWIRVKMPNRKKSYIPLKSVKLDIIDTETFGLSTKSKKNRQRIKICQYGLPYMGTRFKLGGSSLTKGIDCSTFARRAFRNAGVMVPSDATAYRLSNCGKAITRAQLKPGDMVFYPHNSRDRSIGHCAIYIGKGYIINASGHQGSKYPSGGIRISKIDYRSPSACKFRNIVGN